MVRAKFIALYSMSTIFPSALIKKLGNDPGLTQRLFVAYAIRSLALDRDRSWHSTSSTSGKRGLQ